MGLGPTLIMEDSILIAFSSAVDKQGSWMQKYFDLPRYRTRNSLVHAISIKRLCDACMRIDPAPTMCPHVPTPPQQDPRRTSFVEEFMADDNDRARVMQEVYGIPMDAVTSIFSRVDIDHLMYKSRVPMSKILWCFPDPRLTTVMHFVDPNGGTNRCVEGKKAFSSQLGMCSLLFNCPEAGHITVLGCMAYPSNSEEEMNQLVHSYCRRMAEIPFFQRCRHLVAVENNFGGPTMANMFFNRFQVCVPPIPLFFGCHQ